MIAQTTAASYLQLILLLCSICAVFLSQLDRYGTLPCKYHNTTILDCSFRSLQDLKPLKSPLGDTAPPVTSKVDLSNNLLTAITGRPFSNFTSLSVLILSCNAIITISPTSFDELFALEILDLSYNRVARLENGTFDDLQNLKTLLLDVNFLTRIPDDVIAPLHSLVELSLQRNNFSTLNFGIGFSNLTNLETLAIGSYENTKTHFRLTNKTFQYFSGALLKNLTLDFVPPDDEPILESGLLEPLKQLKYFESTGLFGFHSFHGIHAPLESLVLGPFYFYWEDFYFDEDFSRWYRIVSSTTLKELHQFNSSLTSLAIYGKEAKIMDYAFSWVSFIQKLDLSILFLQSLPDDVFYGLDNLEELNLSNNRFATVPSNAFHSLNNSLTWLDLSYNRLDRISPDAFEMLTSLEHLYLTGNNIDSSAFLNMLPNLVHLSLQTVDIQNEIMPIYSMTDVELVPVIDSSIDSKQTFPRPFVTVLCTMAPNVERVILSKSETEDTLTCSRKEVVLYQLRIEVVSQVLGTSCPRLTELDMSGCLTDIDKHIQPEIDVPSLQILHAADNKLKTLQQLAFLLNSSFQLEYLDLSNNDIDHIDTTFVNILQNLQTLDLSRNQLTYKSFDFLSHLLSCKILNLGQNYITHVPEPFLATLSGNSSLEELDLSDNPFQCTCEILPFVQWMRKDHTIWLRSNGNYSCSSPSRSVGRSIATLHLDCKSHLPVQLGISTPCAILVLVCVIVTGRFRWHIKYKISNTIGRWRRLHEDIELDWHYDVYIAYEESCDHDLNWVLNELRPNLEGGHDQFKLCIKGRDFVLGRAIADNIADSIQRSRKTMLILSPRFAQSEWCHLETQVARMRLFNENLNVLILVLLEDIPIQSYPLYLTQILCTMEYLKWPSDVIGQSLFWERLRNEIKSPIVVDRRFDV